MSAKYTKSPFKDDHPYLDGKSKRREPPSLHLNPRLEHIAGHRDLKWEALKRDGWTCQRCGRDLGWENAELHHLEYSGRLEDAESLCRKCHAEKDPHRKLA